MRREGTTPSKNLASSHSTSSPRLCGRGPSRTPVRGRGRGHGGEVPAPRGCHVALRHPQPHLQEPELESQLSLTLIRAVPVAVAAANSAKSLRTGEAGGEAGAAQHLRFLSLTLPSVTLALLPRVPGYAVSALSFLPTRNPVVQPLPPSPFSSQPFLG